MDITGKIPCILRLEKNFLNISKLGLRLLSLNFIPRQSSRKYNSF